VAVAQQSKPPENLFTNIPSYHVDSSLNVVLMDGLNTTSPNQAYVRDQMIKYLEKMPEGRPVAVYMLGTKLTLLQDFTSDPEVLKKVVKNLKKTISPLLDNPGGGPDAELLSPGAAEILPANMVNDLQRFEQERVAFQTDLRVRYTIDALTSISRSLTGYPGRKNLIWISEAFPIAIDPNMELTGSDAFAGTRNYAQQIAKLADSLIDAQVAMYPIDARGLVGSSFYDASNAGRDRLGRAARGDRMVAALSAESGNRQAVHGTMQEMADRTGGRAFFNTNGIDQAVRKSIDDGSTYYTLAYYPENKDWNGKFRKIHVTVNKPGVKVRYRLGYFAVNPKTYAAAQSERQQLGAFRLALSPDSPVATGLMFHALVIPPAETAPNKVLVNFGVDSHAISFERQDDGLQHANVECTVQAYSGKGKLVRGETSTIKAALKPETYARVMHEGFPCQQAIELPPGSYFLRLGVRDDSTGLIGTTNGRVTVAGPAAGALSEKK